MQRQIFPALLRGWLLAPYAAFSVSAAVVDLRPQGDENLPLANSHKGWYHHYPDNPINKYQVARDRPVASWKKDTGRRASSTH